MIEEHPGVRILQSEVQDDLRNDHMISTIETNTTDKIFSKAQPIQVGEQEQFFSWWKIHKTYTSNCQ